MPNKKSFDPGPDISELSMPDTDKARAPDTPEGKTQDAELGFTDRRKKAPRQDTLYQCVVILNMLAWGLLVAALIVFHYARPEFITGVQNYWEIDGRDFWSAEHLDNLLTLLQICLFFTIITIILRSRRSRRKRDRFGINILILLVISVTSLVTIYLTV